MKLKLFYFILLFNLLNNAFAQLNSALGPDHRVSICNLIPTNSYTPPNTLRFNMGCDKLEIGSQKPDWIAIVSDYFCDSTGGSSLYLQNLPNQTLDLAVCIDSNNAPGLTQACDPDVAYFNNSLIVVYYKIDFQNAMVHFYAKKYDLTGGTLICHTTNLIGSCIWNPAIIPSINVDANQLGDIAIVYSDCTQNSYVLWSNSSTTFPGSPSLLQYSGLTSSTQADITIDESTNPTVYVSYLTNNNQTWEVCRYNSSTFILEFSQVLLLSGTTFDEPRIASPAKASGPTRWSACVCQLDANTLTSDIFFVCSDNSYNLSQVYSLAYGNPVQLTNTITGQTLNPLWNDIYNRPSIAYNNINCNSISVNYYNVSLRNHFGVEIDNLFSASSNPFCTYRILSSTNPANTLQVNNCLCYGEPNATCGRFSDIKVATFTCNLMQSSLPKISHYSHVYDCVGSWRAFNSQIKPVKNITPKLYVGATSIHPNPTTENLFMSNLSEGIYTYQIYNSLGLLTKTGTLNVSDLHTESPINVGGLVPGFYQISIKGINSSSNFNFVKQ